MKGYRVAKPVQHYHSAKFTAIVKTQVASLSAALWSILFLELVKHENLQGVERQQFDSSVQATAAKHVGLTYFFQHRHGFVVVTLIEDYTALNSTSTAIQHRTDFEFSCGATKCPIAMIR